MRYSPLQDFVDLYRPAIKIALNEHRFKQVLVHRLNRLQTTAYPSIPDSTVKAAQRAAFLCMLDDDDR